MIDILKDIDNVIKSKFIELELGCDSKEEYYYKVIAVLSAFAKKSLLELGEMSLAINNIVDLSLKQTPEALSEERDLTDLEKFAIATTSTIGEA